MKSRRRTIRWLIGSLVVIVVAGGLAVVLVRHRAFSTPPPSAPAAAAMVRLERRDLSTTVALPGTIGYGAARPIMGHLNATVTWLPMAGTTISRGHQLYRADDRPVPLFYGSLPLYRPVTGPNLVGRDVQMVADNLEALGYVSGRQPVPGTRMGAVTIRDGDAVLTTSLTAAIKRWQADVGLPVTGTVSVGDVEVQPGSVRVDTISAQPGSLANGPLLSVTSTRKVVTVPADLDDAASIEQGEKVTVALPDDRTLKGRVTLVGRKLAAPDDSTGPPQLAVTVTVDDPKAIARIDAADVKVNFAGRTVKGVLAAPIEALVALTEGGYAVQGPAGLVAVHTGMFADGWVEISGPGLLPGTEVVVSS